MDPVKVGLAIKTLRNQNGYTQHQLADLMGVTDQAVSKWERGLSVPDISIVTKLSVLLNVDVDNLLEGNITYLEKTWQGLLILKEDFEIFCGSEAYGKPLVYFYLSYFMLAGIGEIYIDCPERDRGWIEERIGDGSRYGIELIFSRPKEARNTMVVYNNPFVYGPNLTKYFQRAMSRLYGISVLTVAKTIGGKEIQVSYDNYKAVQNADQNGIVQFCAPIVFFPKKYFDQIVQVEDITLLEPLYAEPMGNGMIEYPIMDEDSLWDTSSFLRYLKKCMGKEIYNLEEIAKNRNFVDLGE
ncbi:MAG: helix-turn-helix domain-containing protein [Ruminococcus sp.]|nr:helix-turn-helix domain-containing protein [Ruminococcus sp.]